MTLFESNTDKPKFTLRSNQIPAVEKGTSFFKSKSIRPSIIVAPTAYGKSIVIASIAKEIDGRTIILQPSKELLEQNYNKLIALGGQACIYSASMNQKNIGKITYATIGSIKNIGQKFKNLGFTNLIIDEAHLYPRSESSMFGTFMKSAQIKTVLGLTATPFRLQTNTDMMRNKFSKLVMLTNRSKQGNFFHDIIHVTQIKEMVDSKFWTKLEYETYDMDSGMLKFNTIGSEYTDESLEAFLKINNIEGRIVEWSKRTSKKSALIFLPTVVSAKNISNQIPQSAVVYGDMPKDERDYTISQFKAGKIRFILNVNVLSVGFDYPQIDAIVMGRPTASLAWYYQVLGRGTRIHPDKKDCLIVDFTNNTEKFGKIEDMYFKKENTWKLYGTKGKLLTGIPMSEIGIHFDPEKEANKPLSNIVIKFGKHAGKKVSEIPHDYLKWMLKEFKFTNHNMNLKTEIEKVLKINQSIEI